VRVLLCYAATDRHVKITRLSVSDLTVDRVRAANRHDR
jgi:hypothetical protein